MPFLIRLLQFRTHCQTPLGLVAVTSIALILANAFYIVAHFKPEEPYRLISDTILMAYLAYTLSIFTPHGTFHRNKRLVIVYGVLVTICILLMLVIWGLRFAQVQNIEVVDWLEHVLNQLQAVASLWHFKLRSFRGTTVAPPVSTLGSSNIEMVIPNLPSPNVPAVVVDV